MTDAELAALFVERLNEIHAVDPEAIDALVKHRVHCGTDLAAHPTVQIDGTLESGGLVGLVGVLNGLLGTPSPDGFPRIVARLGQRPDGSVYGAGFEVHKP